MLFRYLVQPQSPTLLRSFIRRRGQHTLSLDTRTKNATSNEDIITMLRREQEAEERETMPNIFKINAFANAIQAISQIQEPIKSGDDYALEVKGIGIGIKNRINQYFVEQDLLQAVGFEEQQDALRRRAVLELQKIPGVGRAKAKALVNEGCWSIESLLNSEKYQSKLTAQQRVCFKYADHLDEPTSREQANQILELCTRYLSSKYEAILAGEYRRGSPTISTPVIILLHPDCVHVPMPADAPDFLSPRSSKSKSQPHSPTPSTSTSSPSSPSTKRRHIIKKSELSSTLTKAARKTSLLHTDVIPSLKNGEVVFDTLAETLNTWTAVVRIPGEGLGRASAASAFQIPPGDYRRVIFHLVPQKSRATALLALTGDDHLNRHLRKKAERGGMLLNEYGLWKWNSLGTTTTSSEPSTNITSALDDDVSGTDDDGYWGLVNTPTEHDVFAALDAPFVNPLKRNWEFLSGASTLRRAPKRWSTSFVGSMR